ncbi:MAG: nitrate reductase molybdenum cofactor assembly chaperone [Ramlibacter sp.]|nr:nitrate reductase molybdenum cofactor assembly chaperone [Ramlibacter sp.]
MAAATGQAGGTARRKGAITLRVLAALLSYPDAALRAHLGEMGALLASDGALTAGRLAELRALMQQLADSQPVDAEVAYVELFDRGRATSLYLFEHVHGDSRDRGPAMIDLGEMYAKAGLLLTPDELPDYLPVMLEFISTQPPREARNFLDEIAHLLNAIFSALRQRGSAYASVLGALLDLAGRKAQPVEPAREAELDESWSEPPAFDGCSSQGQARPGQPQPVRIVRKPDNPLQGAAR